MCSASCCGLICTPCYHGVRRFEENNNTLTLLGPTIKLHGASKKTTSAAARVKHPTTFTQTHTHMIETRSYRACLTEHVCQTNRILVSCQQTHTTRHHPCKMIPKPSQPAITKNTIRLLTSDTHNIQWPKEHADTHTSLAFCCTHCSPGACNNCSSTQHTTPHHTQALTPHHTRPPHDLLKPKATLPSLAVVVGWRLLVP